MKSETFENSSIFKTKATWYKRGIITEIVFIHAPCIWTWAFRQEWDIGFLFLENETVARKSVNPVI